MSGADERLVARPIAVGPVAGPGRMLPPSRAVPPLSRSRPSPTAGQLARRRILVRLGTWVLPMLAVALLGAIVLWPEFERTEDRARMSFRRTVAPRAEALRVLAPRYQGVDERGRAYTITADLAEQPGAEPLLDLTEPRADVVLADGAWLYLQSARGRYDRPGSRLALSGEVTLHHDNGTLLVTEAATVQLDQGSASGDRPVAAQGGFGTLTAEGFRLTERGAVVVFTGRARAVLEGSR